MKIDPISSYGMYPSDTKKRVTRPAGGAVSAPAGNTDVVSFGSGRKELGQIVQGTLRELNAPESGGRLEALRSAVADGSYHVSSSDLANAILGRAAGRV